jgi:hypothetical protein
MTIANDQATMFEIRRLEQHEIPWRELDAFPDRVVFQTREWLSFIAASHGGTPVVAQIRDGSTVAGYFSGVVVRKFGLRILGSSFPGWTTPYIGFNIRPEYSRLEMLQPLKEWAFRVLGCVHLEVSDRCFLPEYGQTAGLTAGTYETYKSDLTRSEDDLFNGMESACRRCIRKAEKSGVVVPHSQATRQCRSRASRQYRDGAASTTPRTETPSSATRASIAPAIASLTIAV